MKLVVIVLLLVANFAVGQSFVLNGTITDANNEVLPFANIYVEETSKGVVADENGNFSLAFSSQGDYTLVSSFVGYQASRVRVSVPTDNNPLKFSLESDSDLDEVVVSGTLTEVSKKESPVPVEVYKPEFFKKNPNPSVFESMQNVNGVRPQLNCNVCNTGDIHINGLEGPYTMVLIDGMPIVSGLSTVYGLTGIPSSMIERVEIVKGPASSLYGSEAVGGLINVITKSPESHPLFYTELYSTSWLETNLDIGVKNAVGKSADVLTGVNLFHYDNPMDNNGDNFTDVALSKRISIFQKWNFKRRSRKIFSLAGRVYTESRWGGEMQFSDQYRGGDEVYGESIETRRFEILSAYQLPLKEKFVLSTSFNGHYQNSFYGDLPFIANQNIAFSQLTWNKVFGKHHFTSGLAFRYVDYDDNTVATQQYTEYGEIFNKPEYTLIPGMFVQDDISLTKNQKLLLGMRYDLHSNHGNIWTPRMAYKWTVNPKNIIRLNAGTGFRVVNIFTEDHAALTGARDVVIAEDLNSEQSVNLNLNYIRKFYQEKGSYIGLDASVWYTRFTNKIVADYDTDPNLIVYDNLNGYGVSQGITLNIDATVKRNLRMLAGVTFMDVFNAEEVGGEEVKVAPVLTEKWSGTWSISYGIPKYSLTIDYTGNLYGPMRLPLLGEQDPRAEYSPWWSIQNIQLTYASPNGKWEVFGGVKNLLNFTPPSNSIARSHDPFDEEVDFDHDGNVLSTSSNPYALTFDPSYVYAPNQGIRGFVGFRLKIF